MKSLKQNMKAVSISIALITLGIGLSSQAARADATNTNSYISPELTEALRYINNLPKDQREGAVIKFPKNSRDAVEIEIHVKWGVDKTHGVSNTTSSSENSFDAT